MHFYRALILFATVSAACGLTCYSCEGKGCTNTTTCPASSGLDCGSSIDQYCTSVIKLDGVVTKGCINSTRCVPPITCCSTDLCNGATPAASSILLLMASSAIVTLFFKSQEE